MKRSTPASNREVIEHLRAIQQEMRALSVRMDKLAHKQQQVALSYIRRTFTISRTEVSRG